MDQNRISALLDEVHAWPAEEQLALASAILREISSGPLAPPRNTLEQATGLLRANSAVPTDEDVKRWIAEERSAAADREIGIAHDHPA